jgi:phosphoserine phosphatase
MSRRLFALVTALYPRAWRERYAEELSDLCEEFVDAGETTRLRLALTILFAAAVERFRSLRSSRHRVLLASRGNPTLVSPATAKFRMPRSSAS